MKKEFILSWGPEGEFKGQGGGEWQQMASEGLWNISSSVAIENELLCGETADSQSPATRFVQKGHTPKKFYNFLPNHTTNYEPGIQISKPKRDFSHLENSLSNGHLKKSEIQITNKMQNPKHFCFFSPETSFRKNNSRE